MSNVRRGSIPDELGWLVDALDDYAERLRILEAPSGEALANTVATLRALITDIQAQLDAYMAGKYTNAQIDSLIANPPAGSNITGNLSTTGNATVGGALFNVNAYNSEITYTRRTAWVGNDGRFGWASSAESGKTAIEPADIDPAAILTLEPREFYYRAEIQRRTNLRINEGIDYKPKREVGLLAHEVDAVAPWLVYHDDEGAAEGVEYAMLPVALLAVVRDQERRLRALEGDAS